MTSLGIISHFHFIRREKKLVILMRMLNTIGGMLAISVLMRLQLCVQVNVCLCRLTFII